MGSPDIPPPPPPPPPPPADPEDFDEGATAKKKASSRTGLKISLTNSPGTGPNTPASNY